VYENPQRRSPSGLRCYARVAVGPPLGNLRSAPRRFERFKLTVRRPLSRGRFELPVQDLPRVPGIEEAKKLNAVASISGPAV
jgi:hypothetical protein